jgi:hypothetical protein
MEILRIPGRTAVENRSDSGVKLSDFTLELPGVRVGSTGMHPVMI